MVIKCLATVTLSRAGVSSYIYINIGLHLLVLQPPQSLLVFLKKTSIAIIIIIQKYHLKYEMLCVNGELRSYIYMYIYIHIYA